jgi:hypothetical protein
MRGSQLMVTCLPLFLLAACGQGGGNKAAPAANNASAANAATPAPAANAGAAAPAGAAAIAARPVRFGIDGEHDLDACHTNGRLSGQDVIAIREAPDANARQVDQGEPGLEVELCEEQAGWRGIVWRAKGDPERDCGTGANLARPKDYDGPCRSGWVPEQNFEVTAG